ncbi:O-antigen translocase [Vibrio splendidus]|uniref:O-antigen translocase n=1 Tax=Vibrio splendidus TaxID=29497 RepID=UPI00352C4939
MTEQNKNYSRIMKSSSLIGGAQGINMLIGMIRVKFVAILIGPVGVGLVATYQSLTQMIGTVAGLGLQSSAVRDIAQAVSQADQKHIGRTVLSLQRMCWLTGGLGFLAVILFSSALSQLTFNSPDYAAEVSLVGVTILFANLKGGQTALIQGMRRVGDLAKLNVIGAVSGTIISICLYWIFGVRGIAPAIVLLSFTELCASWWFARKVEVPNVTMSWIESFKISGGMVKMGLAFMWSSLLIAIVAYLTRTLIAQEVSLTAVGIFSAAFALSGMLVNFVLGAMGADYYPSLTAINTDHKKMRELVNQQSEIGLLLAIPGLLATLAFAPWVIKLFYTSEFSQAADLLRWFALGCVGRVISWPLGFIILAKGHSRLLAFTETIMSAIHVILIIFFLNWIGIEGVAIAYPILYLIHIGMMLFVSKKMIGMRWSSGVLSMLAYMIPVVITTFVIGIYLPVIPSTIIGLILTSSISLFCLRELVVRLGTEHKVSRIILKLPLIKTICSIKVI